MIDLIKLSDSRNFKELQSFFSSQIPYSDFSPISLVSWSHGKPLLYSLSEYGLVLHMPDYLSDGYLYSLFLTKIDKVFIDELKVLSTKYNNVPETNALILARYGNLTEDRDAFDYIYDIDKLAHLNELNTDVRRKLNKFEALYPTIVVKPLDLRLSPIRDNIIRLTELWCEQKSFTPTETENEVNAVLTYIQYAQLINDFSIGIYNADKLIAFTLNEIHSNDWALGHFGKSDYDYKYVSIVSEIYTARLLAKHGVRLLNNQQDTGIQSLRIFKESLLPLNYLKKFTLSL